MKSALKMLLPIAVVVIIGIGSWWGYKTFYRDKTIVSYKMENVTREDLTSSISASGTVEPEELINVGAQVSGKIMSFGTDAEGNTVDYGSFVKAGTLLAQIDDVLYAAALREVNAQKLQAEAAITSAQASIRQAEAKLNLAGINWKRAQELYNKKAISKSDYDDSEAAYISAQADSAAAKADLESRGLLITELNAAMINAAPDRIGFPGSPTKVKQVMSVVLTAGEAKTVQPTADGIAELIHELISDHTLG